jgi:hypothetical protein
MVALAAVVATACGPDLSPAVPAGPTTLRPFLEQTSDAGVAQLSGVWSGPLVLTAIFGGTGAVADALALQCVGDAFAARIGSDNVSSLVIAQDGRALTARLVSAETGLAGTYAGTAAATQMVLDAASWDFTVLNALCPGGGELAVSLAGSSIIADVVGQTPTEFSGRVAHTFNVDRKPDGPIGSVVAQYDLRMTKR